MSSFSNGDDPVDVLERSLYDLENVTPDVLRQLAEDTAHASDDYLREQLYRSLCATHLRQGDLLQMEATVAQWMHTGPLSLHSSLWVAQVLRQIDRPQLALQALLPHVDADWHARSSAARLQWIDLIVRTLQDLHDRVTAVEVCEQLVLLSSSLGHVGDAAFDLDTEGAVAFYASLAEVYLVFARIDRACDRHVIEYAERRKAAVFARGLDAVPVLISEEERATYKALVGRLAELEALSAKSYRDSLAARPPRDRLTRQGRMSMLDSGTIVSRSELLSERNREQELEHVRQRLLSLRAKWPASFSRLAGSATGSHSLYEEIDRLAVNANVASLIYIVDRAEETVLIFLVDSNGRHERFASSVTIHSLDALIFMLDHYPDGEFDYIVSALSEALLPQKLCDRLEVLRGASIVLSADPRLCGVPWEGLGRGRLRLGTCFALTNTVSLLMPCRQVHNLPQPLLDVSRVQIVIDPTHTLPGAEDEGYEVCRMLKARGIATALGRGSSVADMLKQLETAQLLHFAGHTRFSRIDPTSSAMLMADGPLTAAEIGAADLKGAIIVLSSCSSGRGAVAAEIESPIGVGNAFMLAGATAVVATNWLAEDGASDWLMTSFYRALLDHPTDTLAEILRRFRSELFEDEEPLKKWAMYSLWGHPFAKVSLPEANS